MMWGKKEIAGTVYDLTHLDPFEMEVPVGLYLAETRGCVSYIIALF